jgi:hypothetical protein
MIERVHEHIIGELNTNTRTDTIFVLTAIILNLIILLANSIIASNRGGGITTTILMVSLVALIIVISIVAEIGLIRGRQMRKKLLDGLMKMYQDQGVAGYYDLSLIGDYKVRYNLFMLTVLVTGLLALIIPFILRAA